MTMNNEDKISSQQLIDVATAEPSDLLTIERIRLKMKRKQQAKSPTPVALLITENFGSRGSAMLRAALNESNRLARCTPPKPRPKLVQVDGDEIMTKRSKVLFREPVVTEQYEYEPTYLDPECLTPRRPSKGSENDNPRKKSTPYSKSTIRSPHKPQLNRAIPSDSERKTNNFGIIHDNEDDTDDELYTIASSNFPPETLVSENCSPSKGHGKRPHEVNSEDDGKSSGNSLESSQEDGCLFSSPKVAKIAPYYHDSDDTPVSEPRLHKATNRSQTDTTTNLVHQRLYHSMKAQHDDANDQCETGLQPQIQPSTYINSWISTVGSFLSNQMNKFIY